LVKNYLHDKRLDLRKKLPPLYRFVVILVVIYYWWFEFLFQAEQLLMLNVMGIHHLPQPGRWNAGYPHFI
jgi:hypothetical protein